MGRPAEGEPGPPGRGDGHGQRRGAGGLGQREGRSPAKMFGGEPGAQRPEHRRRRPDAVEQLGHACIGRVAARRAVDPALTWLEPHDATAPRTIVLCYPRRRPVSATARSLITAIRAQPA